MKRTRTDGCLNRELLKLFALGRLPVDQREIAAEHLARCPDCAAIIAELGDVPDRMISALRQPVPSDAFAAEPQCGQMIHQVLTATGRLREAPTIPPRDDRAEGANVQSLRSTNGSDAVSTPSSAASAGAGLIPEQFGRYKIIRSLGSGGMGSVYLAHDTQLGRNVALKIPHFSANSGREILERFYREARSAATIDHPNICPVFDVGEINGTHYFTMAYIEGKSLSEFVQVNKSVQPRQIAAIVRKVARALAAGHARGVVHRDLKPSNIMVNKARELVIMDFGLACGLEPPKAGEVRLTKSGVILGTPAYMAPEQVAGDSAVIGPACDIYSAGVILYELLAGRLPFQGNPVVVMAQVLMNEPNPPSKHREGVDPRLESICLKAMAKSPGDRYQSMTELAEALNDYLRDGSQAASAATRQDVAGETNAAVRTPPPQRHVADQGIAVSKLFRTTINPEQQQAPLHRITNAKATRIQRKDINWPVALCTATVLAVLLGGVIYVVTDYGRIRIDFHDQDVQVAVLRGGEEVAIVDRQTGSQVRVRSGAYEVVLKSDRSDVRVSPGQLTLSRGGEQIVEIVSNDRSSSPVVPTPTDSGAAVITGKEHKESASSVAKLQPPPAGLPATPFDTLRREDIAEHQLVAAGSGDPNRAPPELVAVLGDHRLRHWSGVTEVLFAKNDKQVISSSFDGQVAVWDVASGHLLRAIPRNDNWGGYVQSIVLADDETTLVACSGRGDNTKPHVTRLWDMATGDEKQRIPLTGNRLVITPDGKTLACAARANIELGDLADLVAGKTPRVLGGHSSAIHSLALSPNGKLLASGSADETVRVWDVATGAELRVLSGYKGEVRAVAFTPDGDRIVMGVADGQVRVWNLGSDKVERALAGHKGVLRALAISPDGKSLVTAGEEVNIWNLETGKIRATHRRNTYSVAFNRDGKFIACASGTRVTLYDTDSGTDRFAPTGHQGEVFSLAVSPDGTTLAVGSDDGRAEPGATIKLWDVASGKLIRTFLRQGVRVLSLAYTPDGKELVAGQTAGTVAFWDVATGEEKPKFDQGHTCVAVSPDGARLAVSHYAGSIRVFDRTSGTLRQVLRYGQDRHYPFAAFSHNGQLLASGGKVWNLATGDETQLEGGAHDGTGWGMAFSPDGTQVASGGFYGPGRLWDVATGKERLSLTSGHYSIVFSSDGRSLATAGMKNEVTLWDTKDRKDISRRSIKLGPPTGYIQQVSFSPDDRHLVVLNRNCSIFVLRLANQ